MKAEEFNKLSKREQFVLVAKDAVAQVKSGLFKPLTGSFIALNWKTKKPKAETSLQRYLNKRALINCEVCALGGLMLSAVRLKNNVKTAACDVPEPENGEFGKILRQFTSRKQRELIEIAFELGYGYYYSYDNYLELSEDDEVFEKALNFGGKYVSYQERFLAIMENIIANKGIFKP